MRYSLLSQLWGRERNLSITGSKKEIQDLEKIIIKKFKAKRIQGWFQ